MTQPVREMLNTIEQRANIVHTPHDDLARFIQNITASQRDVVPLCAALRLAYIVLESAAAPVNTTMELYRYRTDMRETAATAKQKIAELLAQQNNRPAGFTMQEVASMLAKLQAAGIPVSEIQRSAAMDGLNTKSQARDYPVKGDTWVHRKTGQRITFNYDCIIKGTKLYQDWCAWTENAELLR